MFNPTEFLRLPGPVDVLPESPAWHGPTGQVFWVDHATRTLNSVALCQQIYTPHNLETDGNLRFVKTVSDTLLLVGSERRIYEYNLETEMLAPFESLPPLTDATCINDGAIGPGGRIVVAVSDLKEENAIGGFFLLEDQSWSLIADGMVVANGPAFSPCGRMLYLSDTFGRRILRYSLEGRSIDLFCDLSDRDGYPDGLFTDPQGNLFISYWAGRAIEIYSPDAALSERIVIGKANATCCCAFDSDGTRHLLITCCDDEDTVHASGAYLKTLGAPE